MKNLPIIITFPRTNIAFRLATDYCSLEKMAASIFQSSNDFYDEEEKVYNAALSANHGMGDEFKEVMTSGKEEEKKHLINKIKFLVQDERVVQFQLCLYNLIKIHNNKFPSLEIKKGRHYDHYIKNGILVTSHFLSCANYILKEQIPDELKEKLPIPERIEVNESRGKEKMTKLKVNLTAKQLTYLFKLLQDSRVINGITSKEICLFIKEHFASKGSDDMDLKNLENIYGEPEKDSAIYWVKKLKEMRDKALAL